MLICKWDKLPAEMQNEEVKPYWIKLRKRNWHLFWKRAFDIFASLILLSLLLPLFLLIAIAIKLDSKGPVFYRQIRYTQYRKEFKIHKFRSMNIDADKGSLVTIKNDTRITKVGKFIRKFKIDELPQLIDVLQGKMSFVGTRPEVKKYVDKYSKEMLASLLLPAGITSMASLLYKDENELLNSNKDIDKTYIEQILPNKMGYNLREIAKESVFYDIKVIFMTFFALLGKKYADDSINKERK